MDRLCEAYVNTSDDEDGGTMMAFRSPRGAGDGKRSELTRVCSDVAQITHSHLFGEAPLPGRYISKRERALLSSPSVTNAADCTSSPAFAALPVVGSLSESNIRNDILSSLKSAKFHQGKHCRIPARLTVSLNGHTKPVNAVHWSPTHPHILASAGMDETLRIWNVWSRDPSKASIFNYHNAAVKDVRWSAQGCFLLSCGYDCSSTLFDVEKGIPLKTFKENQVINSIKFQPDNPNLFLSGGARGSLKLWDIRLEKVVQDYIRNLGPVLDIEFNGNAKHFVSSSDVSRSNLSENAIIVWDVCRAVPLSNQVYVEAYTCPCVRYHPYDSSFVAQSNGNYIAIFSSRPPFKLDRYKRYEKHKVSGFPVKCNFSLDGRILASGSSDGSIYLYNYRSSEILGQIRIYEQACIDVSFHPILSNVIATCSWSGDISICE